MPITSAGQEYLNTLYRDTAAFYARHKDLWSKSIPAEEVEEQRQRDIQIAAINITTETRSCKL